MADRKPAPEAIDPDTMTVEEWQRAYFTALAIAQSEIDRLRKALWEVENDAISIVRVARVALEPRESPDLYPPHPRLFEGTPDAD